MKSWVRFNFLGRKPPSGDYRHNPIHVCVILRAYRHKRHLHNCTNMPHFNQNGYTFRMGCWSIIRIVHGFSKMHRVSKPADSAVWRSDGSQPHLRRGKRPGLSCHWKDGRAREMPRRIHQTRFPKTSWIRSDTHSVSH